MGDKTKNRQQLTFDLPVFLCESHQRIFWTELKSISGITHLCRDKFSFTLTINTPLEKETYNKLYYLFSYWHIEQTPLTCHQEN